MDRARIYRGELLGSVPSILLVDLEIYTCVDAKSMGKQAEALEVGMQLRPDIY